MLSFGRLLWIGALALLIYTGFYAAPLGGPEQDAYTPERVAAHEVALWQAARAREEFPAFLSATRLLRERERYSWFRAAQAGFYVSRADTTFTGLRGRYERILPDLEAAAEIQKAWTGASFDPAAVARAELNWRVTVHIEQLKALDQVAPLIEHDYELRYGLRSGAASEAAFRRAEAILMFDASRTDPNLPAITKLLTESYQSLQRLLVERHHPARD